MTVPVFRDVSQEEIARWRRERGGGRGVASFAASPRRDVDPSPLPDFRPARPEAVYKRLMGQLQEWARTDKATWMVSVAMFRKQNPTATAHMTDEQLYELLRGKIEQSIKEAYSTMGRGRELQIKTGGF